MSLVVKDAFWQILGRFFSAIAGFFVIKLLTPYLGPLRYGDYSTILKYFAIWSAFADFGLYVIALRELGKIKNNNYNNENKTSNEELITLYNKFVGTRFFLIFIVYTTALVIAYLLPSYTSNPFLIYGLPIGMLFSASFMAAGIIQIPLQLFWKMKQLTKALILSRFVQIIILILTIFIFFKNVNFEHPNKISIIAFEMILLSVLLSGFTQLLYVRWSGKKLLPFNPIFDIKFIKRILKNNRKYGLAYYLSSFHTLVVLIILSILFPTSKGFYYTGIWALSLSLIEILLIIPSALGNSLIHKISNLNIKEKKKKFGNLIILITWIGGIILINFSIFSSNIIYFISGNKFLTHNLKIIGSDFILPFLGIVLILSFVKQVFNYIFVSENLQNKLLYINLFGLTIGLLIGIPLIFKFNLIGGIITQLLLEFLFVIGSLVVAYKHGLIPEIKYRQFVYILSILSILALLGILGKNLLKLYYNEIIKFLILATSLNILSIIISYKPIKNIVKSL